MDTFHPHIKNGEIDSTPAQIFREHFTRNLRDFLDLSPGSIVLLVPSIRDLTNNHAVFPQGEFDIGFAGDPVSLCVSVPPDSFSLITASSASAYYRTHVGLR